MKLAIAAVLAVSASVSAAPLTLEVKPAATVWQVGKSVNVGVRVTNASTTEQTFDVYSCSFSDSFASKDPALGIPGVSCDKNVIHTKKLAPGKAWEDTLEMTASRDGQHQLQLAFTPNGAKAPVAQSTPIAITVVK